MTIEQELTAAQARITQLEADCVDATTKHELAANQAKDNYAKLQTVTAELAQASADLVTAKAEIASLGASNKDLSAKLETATADFANKVNDGVTRALAASGHAPIEAAIDTETKTKPAKSDLSALSGRKKTVAYFAERQPKPLQPVN